MRADRLLSLLMILQIRGRCTAQELAQRLEVSERTIYRDIDALSGAGIPVYAERGPGGGCMLAEGYRTSLTGLTSEEVRSLFMACMSGTLADLGIGHEVEAALLKLLAHLPSTQQRIDIERGRQRLYMDTTWWSFEPEPVPFLPLIQDAIWQERRLRLTYRKNNGEVSERVVDPLALVIKTCVWYMVACSNGDPRIFRVSRIRDVVMLDEPCVRPPDFDLPTFWKEACANILTQSMLYPVTLRFDARYLKLLPQIMGEGMHRLLEEAGPPDANGYITLVLHFSSFEQARSRVFDLGIMAQVVEPQELRESVVHFARQIIATYQIEAQRQEK